MDQEYEKRGVQNPAIIDLITFDSEHGEVVLVMIETRGWSHGREQLEQLNDKLNSYFTYVVDGHLASQYPQYRGLPLRLQVDCAEEPQGDARKMLAEARRLAEHYGLGFAIRVVRPEEIARAPWEVD